MSLSGKVVIVTGASSGIGESTAIEFYKRGAHVVLTGRSLENLRKVEKECKATGNKHAKSLLVKADLTKESDIKKLIYETISTFEKLDVLVNNAGIFGLGSIETATIQQFDEIFNTNVRGVFLLTQLAIPHLIKSKGNIINISSINGVRSFPNVLSYCMSKAALDQFTRCTALDLAPKQVRVNSVNPGVIDTPILLRAGMTEKQQLDFFEQGKRMHPLGRVGSPEECAKAIAFLASEDASFITGETLLVDGGRHVTVQS